MDYIYLLYESFLSRSFLQHCQFFFAPWSKEEGENPALSDLQRRDVLCIHVTAYIMGLRREGFSDCKGDPGLLITVFTEVLLCSLNIIWKRVTQDLLGSGRMASRLGLLSLAPLPGQTSSTGHLPRSPHLPHGPPHSTSPPGTWPASPP